jgi:hypothetical protein
MKKILIVEDHPDMRELLRAQIDLMGFSAITAKNAFSGPIRPLIPGRFRPPIPVKTGHRSGAFRPPLIVA